MNIGFSSVGEANIIINMVDKFSDSTQPVTALHKAFFKYLTAQDIHFKPTLSKFNLTIIRHGIQVSFLSRSKLQITKLLDS